MKRLLFILLMMCGFVTNVDAQMHFSQWHSSYFPDGDFDIDISSEMEDGEFQIFISVLGDTSNKDCFVIIDNKDLPAFIAFLKDVKAKYMEWTNVAITNNVKELSKMMPCKSPSCTIGWCYGGDYYFSFYKILCPFFTILDDGRMIAAISEEYASSQNEYITEEIYMVFGAESDFDGLIKALDEEAMRAVYASKVSVDELFK